MAWARSTGANKAKSGMSTGQMIGLGGLGAGLYDYMFGGDNPNPADAAMPYLSSIPGQIKPVIEPYTKAGEAAIPGFQEIMSQLMKDPTKFMQMLGAGYQKSPGYDWNLKQGEGAITNAAASGGMLGTPQHEQQAGELATNLASRDYDNYMQNIMKLFGLGAEGESSLIKGGQTAASSLADAIAQTLVAQAQYAYAGQAGQNQASQNQSSNLLNTIGSIASMFL